MKNRLLLFAAVLVLMFSRTVPAQISNFIVKKCDSCTFKNAEITENSRLRFLWYKWENSHRLYLTETDSTGHVTIDFLDISKTLCTGEDYLSCVGFDSKGKYIAVSSAYLTPYMINYCTVGITDSTGSFFYRHAKIKYSGLTTDVCFLTDTTFIFAYLLENSYQYHEYNHPVVILEKYKITETDTGTTVNKTGTIVVNDEHIGENYYSVYSPVIVKHNSSKEFYVFWTDNKTGKECLYGLRVNTELIPTSQIFGLLITANFSTGYARLQTDTEGNIYTIWLEKTNNEYQLWYRKFGKNFTSAEDKILLYSNTHYIYYNFCVEDNGYMYIIYTKGAESGDTIVLQGYTINGLKKGQKMELSGECEFPFNEYPEIIIQNNLLYTTWQNKNSRLGSSQTNIYCSIIPADNVTSVNEKPEQISKHKKCDIEIFPNPFNSNVTISFSTLQNAQAEIKIYNIIGRCIKTLTDKRYSAGVHRINWNGTDEYGLDAASGIYIVNINAGNMHIRKKIALVR